MWRFVLLLSFFPCFAQAQDEVAEADTAKESAKILIIPFEEKLFYCDIMRDLTVVNKLTQQQIFDRFRNEIQLSLKKALKDSMETATFLNTDSITDEDLIDIYSVLGYKFVPVPTIEDLDEKGKPKKTKKKAEPKKEVGIRKGQVVAERQVSERYMNAFLKDNAVLSKLDSVYGLNRFLFINQMDVKMDLSDPETAFLDPRRVVAIHYTIMDKAGKQISGGLSSAQFAGTESNMNHIIGGCLYKLSAEVMKSLMIAEKRAEEEAEKESNRQPKKSRKDN
jgi:hypothetical protein